MTLALVETLYDVNASDVPGMMRKSADSIEAETDEHDRTKSMIAVQVTHGGAVAIYGWGATDRFAAIGALQAAIVKMADQVEEHEA